MDQLENSTDLKGESDKEIGKFVSHSVLLTPLLTLKIEVRRQRIIHLIALRCHLVDLAPCACV